jgi:hypothetical protein
MVASSILSGNARVFPERIEIVVEHGLHMTFEKRDKIFCVTWVIGLFDFFFF